MSQLGILVGAGRMGLTHLALLNLLTDFRIRWMIVEPSALVRWGLHQSLPRASVEAFLPEIPRDASGFDLAVVTSPTTAHAAAHARLAASVRKIFVEKPLAVPRPSSNTMCGYVLLHHPLHERVRVSVAGRVPENLRVTLRANTVLGPNTGWRGRADRGGGVINEFGSHALSLVVDLLGPIAEIGVRAKETVHSIDVPDRATLAGRSRAGTPFEVQLDWTDASTRKPSYAVRVEHAGGAFAEHDFSEYRDPTGSSSIADEQSRLGHYLRGIEFTRQARCFLEHDTFPESLAVAVEVDRLLGALR